MSVCVSFPTGMGSGIALIKNQIVPLKPAGMRSILIPLSKIEIIWSPKNSILFSSSALKDFQIKSLY